MLSSPTNSKEPSSSSSLNTRITPFGRGIPSPCFLVFFKSIWLDALMFSWEQPPAFIRIWQYFLRGMLQTFGMNSTCFWEASVRVTGQLRVQRWQSPNDFYPKLGAAATSSAIAQTSPGWQPFVDELTVFTSPAMSFNLAFSYFLPLLLSIVTHPPKSALVSSEFRVREQSDFHENPVVRYATQQSVVCLPSLKTFQFKVGVVKNPSGNDGNSMPAMLLKILIPFAV